MTDKRLKVALIGAGGVVMVKHVEAYAALAERLIPWVICDPSDANRQRAAAHFGVPPERCVASLDELQRFRKDTVPAWWYHALDDWDRTREHKHESCQDTFCRPSRGRGV